MSDHRDAVIREIQNLPTSYRVQTLLEEAVRSAYAGDEIEAPAHIEIQMQHQISELSETL